MNSYLSVRLRNLGMILLHWSLIFLALRKVACEKTINDLFNDQEIEYRSESFGLAKDLLDLAPSDVDHQMVKIGSALRKKLGIILEKGNEIIPDVSLSKIIANNGQIPERVAQKMRKRGVLIVRDVVPRETIHDWRASLVQYIYNNNAFPKGNQVCNIKNICHSYSDQLLTCVLSYCRL